MIIQRPEGVTREMGKPKNWNDDTMGQCMTLPIRDEIDPIVGENVMYSEYTPHPEELEALINGGRLRLGIHGTSHPVINLAVLVPAGKEQNYALQDVIAERRRQVEVEGWTAEHDDQHDKGEMAIAAQGYVGSAVQVIARIHPGPAGVPDNWPWAVKWWKPKGPRQDLVRAAALILAEIERLDRAKERRARPQEQPA